MNATRPGQIRVLVQLRVTHRASISDIFEIAETWKAKVGFDLDRRYRPVAIKAPPMDAQEALRRPGEQRDAIKYPSDHSIEYPGDRRKEEQLRTVVLRGWIAPAQISVLEQQLGVRRVTPDARLEPFAPPARRVAVDCTAAGEPIGDVKRLVKQLGVDRIWGAGYDGAGIVVAVVDGGLTARGQPVNPSEDPAIPTLPATGQVVWGWPQDWGTTSVGWGQHGNMMAFDIQAVAPAAKLWDIRIFEPGASFGAYVSNALAGYREAIDTHRMSGEPHILSNSWGLYDSANGPDFAFNPHSEFALIVQEALDEGILVLFAAGNCGDACPFSLCGAGSKGPGHSILGPNGHPEVMTVGAADLDDDWCGYTSQGPAVLPPNIKKPDFCSYTRFAGYFPSADPVLRDFDGGTSAATAVAAGVVALLKQRKPDLSQDEVKAALRETAQDIWSPGFDQNSGAGIIRAKAAFDCL
jgi:subtilisin family serine protease